MSQITIFSLMAITFISGCGATGNIHQTNMATRAVMQVDQSKIKHLSISTLHTSSLQGVTPSEYAGEVVEITGIVIAYALVENDLYTVTLREDDSDAICMFDNSISGKLGDSRPIRAGATLTIQGQFHTTGLFSSNPFTLDGCRIAN